MTLLYHYTNPKFAGKPWAIDGERKKKKKAPGSNRLRKLRRRQKREKRARQKSIFDKNACRTEKFLAKFWTEFCDAQLGHKRITLLCEAANPPWERIDEAHRLRLRRQFGKRYNHLLKNIPEECGACGVNPWEEKHHIVPLCYGGINEEVNLLAICMDCHNEIHPWMKHDAQS